MLPIEEVRFHVTKRWIAVWPHLMELLTEQPNRKYQTLMIATKPDATGPPLFIILMRSIDEAFGPLNQVYMAIGSDRWLMTTQQHLIHHRHFVLYDHKMMKRSLKPFISPLEIGLVGANCLALDWETGQTAALPYGAGEAPGDYVKRIVAHIKQRPSYVKNITWIRQTGQEISMYRLAACLGIDHMLLTADGLFLLLWYDGIKNTVYVGIRFQPFERCEVCFRDLVLLDGPGGSVERSVAVAEVAVEVIEWF